VFGHAEKFYVSEELLRKLNPRARFDRAGETIAVADVLALSRTEQPLERWSYGQRF
jgi:hypothetical protein